MTYNENNSVIKCPENEAECTEQKTQSELVTQNLGLVHSCANRFRGRGVEYDDLFQAGCVGLIKAAAGFNPELGYQFSTYAVPAVLGEIRRIFRDGGSVKIGRAAKEKARELLKIREELTFNTGTEPSIGEIANKAGLSLTDAACLISACLPTVSLTVDDDSSENDIPVPAPEENITRRIDLENALGKLSETERELITLRYIGGQTQQAVADRLGITQVQVSRKEKSILLRLRKNLS